jgi:hypothetical protein
MPAIFSNNRNAQAVPAFSLRDASITVIGDHQERREQAKASSRRPRFHRNKSEVPATSPLFPRYAGHP